MKLEVLVSTMNQTNFDILEKMNINSDAIIINQSDKMEFNMINHNGNEIKFFDFNERGIGLSRNNALMRSNSDICLFADDDVVYHDGYEHKIIDAFNKNPKADIIVFNVPSMNEKRNSKKIRKSHRVRLHNCLRYGTVKVAVRRKSIMKHSHFFSTIFGASSYGSGEDSIFLYKGIKKGLNIYAVPTEIGRVGNEISTWFDGFTNKYFVDKGALYACLSNRWAKLLTIQFILRHKKKFPKDMKLNEIYKLMCKGISQFRNNDF